MSFAALVVIIALAALFAIEFWLPLSTSFRRVLQVDLIGLSAPLALYDAQFISMDALVASTGLMTAIIIGSAVWVYLHRPKPMAEAQSLSDRQYRTRMREMKVVQPSGEYIRERTNSE